MMGPSGAITVFAVLLALPLHGQASRWGIRTDSADRLLWLSDPLGLTDEQVAALRSIEEDARAVQDSARLEMRAMRDQLRDGEITRGQFLDLSTAHRDAMNEKRETRRERIDSVLTDEQRRQLRSLRGRGIPGRGMRRSGGYRNRGFRWGGRRSGLRPGHDTWGSWSLSRNSPLLLGFGWRLAPDAFR